MDHELIRDALNRDVRASKQSGQGNNTDEDILPELPVAPAKASIPVVDGIDNGRGEEAETGEEDGPAETDEEF